VSLVGLIGYEAVLLACYLRSRSGRPMAVSNAGLNVAAVVYCAWFLFEIRGLHHGLVRTASHLLLFTAAAKFISLRTARELRTTLLLSFFLALDSASTSTHAASLLYLLLLAVVAFRTLARISGLPLPGARSPGCRRRASRRPPSPESPSSPCRSSSLCRASAIPSPPFPSRRNRTSRPSTPPTGWIWRASRRQNATTASFCV
jgi:hypothetical protein